MHKNKHTPGPWWRDDDGFIAAGSGETYVTVADADCSDMDIEEREANKALIASAPELLEELKKIVDANMWQPHGVTVPALDSARIVIAQAEAV